MINFDSTCKFKENDSVVITTLDYINEDQCKGHTIWRVADVLLNHGGENYYILEANGYGTAMYYESKLCKVNLPPSDFYARKDI